MTLAGQASLWLGAAWVLFWGACIVVLLAALFAGLARSVIWQRTLWQVAILGILALLVAEATGMAAGIAQWVRWQSVFFESDNVVPPSAGVATAAPRPLSDPTLEAVGRRAGHPRIAQDNAGTTAGGGVDSDLHAARLPPAPDIRRPAAEVAARGSEGGLADPGRRAAVAVATPPVASAQVAPAPGGRLGRIPTLVWIVVSGLLFARIAWARWLLLRFRRGALYGDPAVQRRAIRLARRLGVRRRVALLEAAGLATPIAFGCLRPVIVVPASFAEEFDAGQQEAMLAHELAHLAAGDPVWQLLSDMAAAMLWWHPLVWWMRRRWQVTSEMAADEACVLVPRGPDTLAACLVLLARRLETRPRPAGMAMAGPGFRSTLGRRVERLLHLSTAGWRPVKRGRSALVTAAMSVVFVLVACSCTARARTRAPFEGGTTMSVFFDGWRQSLAAATLAALLGPVAGDTATFAQHEPVPVAPEREAEGRHEHKAEAREAGERAREKEQREEQAEKPQRERGDKHESPEAAAKMHRHVELREQAAGIRRQLQTLKPHQDAEARELKHALERIEIQLRELEARERPTPDRERLERRLDELKTALQRARLAGRPEVVERLEREARELMQMRQQHAKEGSPIAKDDAQRRRHHIQAAIENLRAAGLHEQAEELARQAERWLHDRPQHREPEGPPHAEHPRFVPRPGFGHEPRGPEAPQLERAVRELHEQVRELRQEMDRIRQHLKESERQR